MKWNGNDIVVGHVFHHSTNWPSLTYIIHSLRDWPTIASRGIHTFSIFVMPRTTKCCVWQVDLTLLLLLLLLLFPFYCWTASLNGRQDKRLAKTFVLNVQLCVRFHTLQANVASKKPGKRPCARFQALAIYIARCKWEMRARHCWSYKPFVTTHLVAMMMMVLVVAVVVVVVSLK